jgi:predicted aconitase
MATQTYQVFLTEFETRYDRWQAAQQPGDPAELKAAQAALPTVNARVLKHIAVLTEEETDPEVRAEIARVMIRANELAAEAQRRR